MHYIIVLTKFRSKWYIFCNFQNLLSKVYDCTQDNNMAIFKMFMRDLKGCKKSSLVKHFTALLQKILTMDGKNLLGVPGVTACFKCLFMCSSFDS